MRTRLPRLRLVSHPEPDGLAARCAAEVRPPILEISVPTGSPQGRVRTNAVTPGAVSRRDNAAMGPNSASPSALPVRCIPVC
jgi:hypothetical protein